MTDTANLEAGFYWVMYFGGWEIAKYRNGMFWRSTHINGTYADVFDEIDPRPIKREDVKPKSWMDNITDLDSMGAGFSGG